jgi:hypothetical protein
MKNAFLTTGGTLTGNMTIRHASYIKGTAPSAENSKGIYFMESGSGTASKNRTALIFNSLNTSNTNSLRLYIYNPTLDSTESKYIYINCDANGTYKAGCTCAFYGAVWNDYAEYRETEDVEPGRVVFEKGDDTLAVATKRLIPACSIVSDTYGFAIGETDKCKTPLAMAGRVLAYPLEDRESFKPGDAVCSGPDGTVSKMTDYEKINYPECIIGYVSCVPEYSVWGENNTLVNNRIWIKVI